MDFQQAYQQFMERHVAARSGERRGRLLRGNRYAETLFAQQVWWPLCGTLDNLHPEYEIFDWNRKSQFIDYAFIPLPFTGDRFGIECDGFQSHVKDLDRESFSYALNRDTFLTGLGWKMLHFSFDDIQHRPEVCRMLLQLAIGPRLVHQPSGMTVSPTEKDVLRLAWQWGKPVRPKDIAEHYAVNFRTARKWLQSLVEKGMMRGVASGKQGAYMCYYEPTEGLHKLL